MAPGASSSPFLDACLRRPVPFTPIWLMRQAGRYMPEYRAVRARLGFLELCKSPEAAAEVTLQPVERLGVDAAILFADILLVLEPLGVGLEFTRGDGPRIERPVRTAAAARGLPRVDVDDALGFVYETVARVRKALADRVPLIGFAGAPFTLASYAIEGGHSSSFAHTKALMYGAPEAWHRFCDLLADIIADYLIAQVEAGVDAVQVFDSWVGALNAADYREFILPHTRRIFSRLADDPVASRVPTIHFGVGTGAILGEIRDAGGDVIGADWRTPLDEAWARIGSDRAIQGNLDPTVLLGPLDRIFAATDDVLARASGRPGHIFNLGHGILPSTPVEHVQALARYVHQKTRG
jgi:uroporphyrinogen decarboxylase